MIIASNHLLSKGLDFPKGAVMRLNLAWQESKEEAEKTLGKLTAFEIYLDYPQGRSKPPKPVITLNEAIALANLFSHVKYFAVSNVESPNTIREIQALLPSHVQMVPKIETKAGVNNLDEIIKKTGVKHIMLDKEDLYVDVGRDSEEFNRLVEVTRAKRDELGFELLEMQGVVFA